MQYLIFTFDYSFSVLFLTSIVPEKLNLFHFYFGYIEFVILFVNCI